MRKFNLFKKLTPQGLKPPRHEGLNIINKNHVIARLGSASAKTIEGSKQSDHSTRNGKIASVGFFCRSTGSMSRNDVKLRNSSISYSLFPIFYFSRPAFTLAEVLITLGIIGVVAAMTIGVLNNQVQTHEYKVAYKKAYSDISQAFTQAIQEQSLTPRTGAYDAVATESEWNMIKNSFKISKECTIAQINECWADGEKLLAQPSASGNSLSIIDGSGRAWAEYHSMENLYLVDTNGSKKPNRYGKDRWIFTLWDANNVRIESGLPAKVGIYSDNDIMGIDWRCAYPPCYYRSWLLE